MKSVKPQQEVWAVFVSTCPLTWSSWTSSFSSLPSITLKTTGTINQHILCYYGAFFAFIFTNIFIWLLSLGLSSHTHSYWLGSPLVPADPSAQLGLCFQLNQLGLVCRRLQRIPEKTETHLLLSMCVQIYKWWKLMHLITYHRSLLPLCSLGTYETCETLWSNTNKSFKCWMKQEFLVKFRWVWGFFSSSFLTLLGTIICKLSTIF